jgi:2-iminobutanoate/2-iminopropanoate deaminase
MEHSVPSSPIDRVVPGALPAGHYSPGVVFNGLIFVSGQLPFPPGMADRTVGTIEQQTQQAMANVAAVLEHGGSSLQRLLSVTIYISDMELWSGVNSAYAAIMGDARPTRAIVPVKELHYGAQIEIQAVGAVG